MLDWVVLVYSFLFGTTMKFADILDEHGFVSFKGSRIIFGILWGITGMILIFKNNYLANLYIAIILAYILRAKIDYVNHGIGANIILFSFIYGIDKKLLFMNWPIILIFFLSLIISGLIHDWLIKEKKIKEKISELSHSVIFYVCIPLVYSLITSNWIVLISLISFVLGYDLIRFISLKKIK